MNIEPASSAFKRSQNPMASHLPELVNGQKLVELLTETVYDHLNDL